MILTLCPMAWGGGGEVGHQEQGEVGLLLLGGGLSEHPPPRRSAPGRVVTWGGRLRANLARTEPALPWGRVTFPQITLRFDFSACPGTEVLFLAL